MKDLVCKPADGNEFIIEGAEAEVDSGVLIITTKQGMLVLAPGRWVSVRDVDFWEAQDKRRSAALGISSREGRE
jgi:ABC-type proline/glycine betaine transport system substrate-binding protein